MKTDRTVTDYWRHFPIHQVTDGVIVSCRGDLTLGWEITLPEAGTLDRESLERINYKFTEAIRLLQPWMLVHRQDIYIKKSYKPEAGTTSYLGRSYEEHFGGREHLVHRQLLFLTLSSKGSALRGTSSCGIYGLPEGFRQKEDDILTLKGAALPFIRKITESCDLSARELKDDELVDHLECYRRLFNRDRQLTDLEYLPGSVVMGDDSLWCWSVSESKDMSRMMYSSRPAERWSSKDSKIYTSSGAAVGLLLDCEHMVNTVYMTVRQDGIMSEVEARKRRMVSMSKHSIVNENNAEELMEFQKSVQQDDSTVVLAHMDVMAWDSTERKAHLQSMVSSALSSMGISSVMNTIDTPVIWYSMMPGAECEMGKENYMKMELEGAMCLNINETYTKDIPGGILKLGDRLRKIPVRMDFQDAARQANYVTNYNAFILGESGAGKSFFTNLLARSCYDAGESIFIIDIGGSYKGLCSVINEESGGRDGHYHEWGAGGRISFDAFQNFSDWLMPSGNLNPDSDGLKFVQSLLQTIWQPERGWDSDSTSIIMTFLRDFARDWNEPRRPVFDDLADYIKGPILEKMNSRDGYTVDNTRVDPKVFHIDKLIRALRDYTSEGIYGFLLNDPEPKDLLNSRFTVFEVSSLADKSENSYDIIYMVVVLCLMTAMNSKMKSTDGYKTLIIEEAWKAIANEMMSGFLTSLWKTSRKYQASAIVVTQQISDIISSGTIRDTIMQNSATKILLKQADNRSNMDDICTLMGLSAHERAMVLSMGRNPGASYREVFITLGGRHSGVYTTEVSPQEVIAFESQFGAKQEFLDLARKIGYINAIDKLTHRS